MNDHGFVIFVNTNVFYWLWWFDGRFNHLNFPTVSWETALCRSQCLGSVDRSIQFCSLSIFFSMLPLLLFWCKNNYMMEWVFVIRYKGGKKKPRKKFFEISNDCQIVLKWLIWKVYLNCYQLKTSVLHVFLFFFFFGMSANVRSYTSVG